MTAWRIRSATGIPSSACFSTVRIYSTEKCFRLIANYLLAQGQVCRKTHSQNGPRFLKRINLVTNYFTANLRCEGIAAVTTHGKRSRELPDDRDRYQVSKQARQYLLNCYDADQFGFISYRSRHAAKVTTVDYIGDSYGIALILTSWIETCVEKVTSPSWSIALIAGITAGAYF